MATTLAAALSAGCRFTGNEEPRPKTIRPDSVAMGHFAQFLDPAFTATPFPVTDSSGREIAHPFLGGLLSPRIQFVDIDGDGDQDLFVHDLEQTLLYLENTGTPQSAAFTWQPGAFGELTVRRWIQFADLDADGDYDVLFDPGQYLIAVRRNLGNATAPDFSGPEYLLKNTADSAIASTGAEFFEFADGDCDGLVDMFYAHTRGTVIFYRNTWDGASWPPAFEHVTDTWQGLSFAEEETFKRSAASSAARAQHGTLNTLAFADVDGDGDRDLIWGDFYYRSLIWAEDTTGRCASPGFRVQYGFPDTVQLWTGGLNKAATTDVDADGDLDLFVGAVGISSRTVTDDKRNFYFYENTGAAGAAGFAYRTSRYLDMLDFGQHAACAVGDLNGDGLPDLLVTNREDDLEGVAGPVYYLENRGSPTAPAFASAGLVPVDLPNGFNFAPATADIDADGDADLFFGDFNGKLFFYRNTGSTSAPVFEREESVFDTIDVGQFSKPAFADLDGDGDLDLAIGNSSGAVNYFENTGTPRLPALGERVRDVLGKPAVGEAAPAFGDLDGDGDMDLVLGTQADSIEVWWNIGSPTEAVFQYNGSIPFANHAVPVLIDLDGDGDLDALAGTGRGGLVYGENVATRP